MSGNFKMVDGKLVEKILEQGQKLRNAMVESILQNDPFSQEINFNKHYNTPRDGSSGVLNKQTDNLIQAYLKGDYLTKEQETSALETIRSMSVLELSKSAKKTLSEDEKKCSCQTCLAYVDGDLKCDLRRDEKDKIKPNFTILKGVDCVKITLHYIQLNESGIKKISSHSDLQQSSLNENYFLEYKVPEILVRNLKKSKVDSGLGSNLVRLCSRRTGQLIQLGQVYIHDIQNLHELDMDKIEMVFKISYRDRRHKTSALFGTAKFDFRSFKEAEHFSVHKNIPINLNEQSPIVLGHLKVTMQLGSNRLYFGKEFINAATLRDKNNEILHDGIQNFDEFNEPHKFKNKIDDDYSTKPLSGPKPVVSAKKSAYFGNSNKENITKAEKQLIFGFVYVSEAQFLNPITNSYITCRPFCQNETSNSRLVTNSSNPLYNFCQRVPLIYEDDLLLQLRENFMVIEFWERVDQVDAVFGLTKVPLHQFYLAYRNQVILNHLIKNRLPVIGTDWWEPIHSVNNDELIGQVQILTALGTEAQIENLETERGFKKDIVKARFVKLPQSGYLRDAVKTSKKPVLINRSTNTSLSPKVKRSETGGIQSELTEKSAKLAKCDIGVQSDLQLKMDEPKKEVSPTKDMLASFLNLLEQKRQPACIETGTNTETPQPEPNTNANLSKTSQLLDSLQKALSLDTNPPTLEEKRNYFKARISIKGANQLPSRRKCKSKKTKNRSSKNDDNILPSTYVTFEALPLGNLYVTPVVPKSITPQWNYECDVNLPSDLLSNDQKRLIFKVWKKSTNVVLQPNMQTDIVIGFAALDLSVLLAGLPNVQGWFNVMDFSGKCNGQINIHVSPLENVSKFLSRKNISRTNDLVVPTNAPTTSKVIETSDSDDGNEPLSRALKRKFTELDEITQRLRLRLSEVVSEDSEEANDDIADQFEDDINNLCIEEDFDLINFEDEAKKIGVNTKSEDNFHILSVTSEKNSDQSSSATLEEKGTNCSSSSSLPTDKQLFEGKQRIDVLLEKLSLISAETTKEFSSRYVSGCSVDTENVLKNLDHNSRPNITAGSNFNALMFQQIYENSTSTDSQTRDSLDTPKTSGSDTSFSDCRPNPDGQGNTSDEKVTN